MYNVYMSKYTSMSPKERLQFVRSLDASYFTNSEHMEFLDDWNHLQKTPPKTRTFTFATKLHTSFIINYLQEFFPSNRHLDSNGNNVLNDHLHKPYYAYIRHNKDKLNSSNLTNQDVGVHYHFYLDFANPRSFASVASELHIPVTILESVKVSKSAILQYLTHENDPNKFHYDISDIVCNFDIVKEREADELFNSDELFNDYYNMREGKMTYHEFYEKYKICIVRHSFSQQLRMADTVYAASKNLPFRSRYGP